MKVSGIYTTELCSFSVLVGDGDDAAVGCGLNSSRVVCVIPVVVIIVVSFVGDEVGRPSECDGGGKVEADDGAEERSVTEDEEDNDEEGSDGEFVDRDVSDDFSTSTDGVCSGLSCRFSELIAV
jgi:hypothetical protein